MQIIFCGRNYGTLQAVPCTQLSMDYLETRDSNVSKLKRDMKVNGLNQEYRYRCLRNVIVHSRNVNVYSRMILIKMSNVLRKGPSSERNVSFFSISTFFYTVQVGKRYCTAWEILNNVLNRDFMSYCRLVYIFRMIGNVWILVCLKVLNDVNIQPLTHIIFSNVICNWCNVM